MNRETLTMFLLGSGGGIKALRNMYPDLSETDVYKVAKQSKSPGDMHKKANAVRNSILKKLLRKRKKKLPPLPPLKPIITKPPLRPVIKKKNINMSKLFNALPFNKTGVWKIELI
jgi:hypothetical protein